MDAALQPVSRYLNKRGVGLIVFSLYVWRSLSIFAYEIILRRPKYSCLQFFGKIVRRLGECRRVSCQWDHVWLSVHGDVELLVLFQTEYNTNIPECHSEMTHTLHEFEPGFISADAPMHPELQLPSFDPFERWGQDHAVIGGE